MTTDTVHHGAETDDAVTRHDARSSACPTYNSWWTTS